MAQQFNGPMLPLFDEPGLGTFAHLPQKVAFQRANRNARALGEPGDRPVGLFGKIRPVWRLVKLGVHRGFSRVISDWQCGQAIF